MMKISDLTEGPDEPLCAASCWLARMMDYFFRINLLLSAWLSIGALVQGQVVACEQNRLFNGRHDCAAVNLNILRHQGSGHHDIQAIGQWAADGRIGGVAHD